jgi:hypothetical protein
MWKKILDTTGHDMFDPERHWANAYLGIFKAVIGDARTNFLLCLEYALRLEFRTQVCPVEYLDEVGRTAVATDIFTLMAQHVNRYARDSMSPRPTIETFLDIAVMFNLAGYVRVKGPQVSRSEIVHAAKKKRYRAIQRCGR